MLLDRRRLLDGYSIAVAMRADRVVNIFNNILIFHFIYYGNTIRRSVENQDDRAA